MFALFCYKSTLSLRGVKRRGNLIAFNSKATRLLRSLNILHFLLAMT